MTAFTNFSPTMPTVLTSVFRLNKLVNTVEWQLFDHEQIPLNFREIGIRTGYRNPRSSPKECLLSAFLPTNETLNFWTHFLPFWYFVWKFRDFCSNDAFVNDPYNWPFLAYVSTVCAWPIVSCMAHLFSVMSDDARHICFFVDYLSLSWYSFGVAIVYHAYSFDQLFFNTLYSKLYLSTSACAALTCTTLACWSRFVANQKVKKIMRVSAFFIPYVVTSVPLVERVLHCYLSSCSDGSIPLHSRQFCWAILGILFYALHIPECFAPGYFDIVGHSHQILHIMGVLASYDQMWACFTDLTSRRQLMLAVDALPSGSFDAGFTFVILILNVFIVVAFSLVLKKNVVRPVFSLSETNLNEIEDKNK